jgi:hypothetical protein
MDEPARSWRDLGYRRRMDVLHHARQGRPYPDPEVAAVALGWARWWRAQPPHRRALAAAPFVLGVYAVLALGLLGGVLTGGELTVDRSWSVAATAGSWLLTTIALVAARVLFVSADAAKVERVNREAPVGPGAGGGS